MRIGVLVLVIFISFISCKAAKERKQCLEYIGENVALNINSIKELKEYINEEVNYDEALWVKDGLVSSKEEVLNFIKNNTADLIKVHCVKGANGTSLNEKGKGVLIFVTNECTQQLKKR